MNKTELNKIAWKGKKVRILFVCLGNICRSPAAQGEMERLVEERGVAERFEIDSAGLYGGHARSRIHI